MLTQRKSLTRGLLLGGLVLTIFSCDSGRRKNEPLPAEPPLYQREKDEKTQLCADYLRLSQAAQRQHYLYALISRKGFGAGGTVDYFRRGQTKLWQDLKKKDPELSRFNTEIEFRISLSRMDSCDAEEKILSKVDGLAFSDLLIKALQAQVSVLDSNSRFEPKVGEERSEAIRVASQSGVTSRVLDSKAGIGYVRIESMVQVQSAQAFYDAVVRLNADIGTRLPLLHDRTTIDRMRVLVVDLRRCPGGHFVSWLTIFNMFDKSKRFLFASHLNVENQITLVDVAQTYAQPFRSERTLDVPVVVLVDRQTASGAEVFARLLQLYRHAVVVGESTFGKATQQWEFDTSALLGRSAEGHALDGRFFITRTLLFYRDKSTHQLTGVMPDLVLGDSLHESLREASGKKDGGRPFAEADLENPIVPTKLAGEINFDLLSLPEEAPFPPSARWPAFEAFFREQRTAVSVEAPVMLNSANREPGVPDDNTLRTVYLLLVNYLNTSADGPS